MTREKQTERRRIDPTKTRRLFEAIRLTSRIVDEVLPFVDSFPGGWRADDESLKAAAVAGYEKACSVVAGVGLKIRHRGLEYTVMDVPGRTAALRIDVEFALAAPLDGPDAPLEWERRSYIGCDAEASERVLWECARRYWLCDKLMLPTEADAYRSAEVGHGAAPRERR